LHRKPGFDEFVERGHGEARGPAENEMEGRSQEGNLVICAIC